MQTAHGYQIPGTEVTQNMGYFEPWCGGFDSCPKCIGRAYHATLVQETREDKIYRVSYMDRNVRLDPSTKARVIVTNHYNENREDPGEMPELTLKEVHVVWFSKTLKNWKALITTEVPDQKYYELTYDGNRNVVYLDVYKKSINITIAD